LETLLLIVAYDQMAAALDHLRSQTARCSEVLTLSPEERARIAKVYRDIEAALTSVEELLAFERSEEG
jgi:hypothetical protein